MWNDNPFTKSINRKAFIESVFKGCCALAIGGLAGRVEAGSRSLHEARFYKKLENGHVECQLCYRHCVIPKNETGHCGIRINKKGELKTYSYGNPAAIQVDPIEKKPFFHFMPGSNAFSLAEIGCNIDCKFCQNWRIAHAEPGELRTYDASPMKISNQSQKNNCPIISFTYSEPTVWSEYVLDCAREAKKHNIRSTVVSNGTWDSRVLSELTSTVDAIKVDLKSIKPNYYRDICDAQLKPVLDNIVQIKKSGVWLELVNLVVTGLNDDDENFKELSKWVRTHVGKDVPVHFTRFQPLYKLKNLSPTPLKKLDRAYDVAKSEGLNYVYVGNIPGHHAQNTLCPRCGNKIIHRVGFWVKENNLKKDKCPECGCEIAGVWN